MSNDKKKESTPEKREKHLADLATGEVRFRVKQMKGFRPGETINVEKKRAEGWAEEGKGEITK